MLKLHVVFLRLLMVVALASLSGSALAQSDKELNAARALADSGFSHYEKGDYAVARERFEQAEAIFHAPPHILYIARCHDKLGQPFEARKMYAKLANEALPADSPPPFVEAQKEAKAELEALDARIPSVTVTVSGAPRATIELDGHPLAAGETKQLAPGQHRVTVKAEGFRTEARELNLASGDHEQITITLQPSDVAVPPTPSPGGGDEGAEDGAPSILIPAVVIGVGVVGVVVGAITGGIALGKADELKANCPIRNMCAPENQQLEDDARTMGTVSTAMFIVGGVIAAAGATWLVISLTSSDGGAEPAAKLHVGPSSLSIEARF